MRPNPVQRVCETCEESFSRPQWAIESGRFCSLGCYRRSLSGAGNPNFKDGRTAFDPLRYQQHASAVRRQRMKTAPGRRFVRLEWEALKVHFGLACLKCKRVEPEIKLVPDHVVPVARGGSKGIENIQPLCGGCNRRKLARTVDYRDGAAQAEVVVRVSYLRWPELVKHTGLSRTTLYRRWRDGALPTPTNLSQRCVGWKRTDIEAWLGSVTKLRRQPSRFTSETARLASRRAVAARVLQVRRRAGSMRWAGTSGSSATGRFRSIGRRRWSGSMGAAGKCVTRRGSRRRGGCA